MLKFPNTLKKDLISLYETKKVGLEGNIVKLIEDEGDVDFKKYLEGCLERDKEQRRKRMDINKRVQEQNKDLLKSQEEYQRIQAELQESLEETRNSMSKSQELRKEAERAREEAERSRNEADKMRIEAEEAKFRAENAKLQVESDLEILQKRTQNELISTIVRVALWVILGVGAVVTVVYLISLFANKDTAVIASTWSNIVGILLTNAFSIVGTIMGVKYASEKNN